jgi:hypothetical protein
MGVWAIAWGSGLEGLGQTAESAAATFCTKPNKFLEATSAKVSDLRTRSKRVLQATRSIAMELALRTAALLHVVDLLLSCVLLSMGWMQEANPLAAMIYEYGGLASLIAFKMSMLIGAVAIITHAVHHAPRLARFACGVTLASGTLAVLMLTMVISFWINVPT